MLWRGSDTKAPALWGECYRKTNIRLDLCVSAADFTMHIRVVTQPPPPPLSSPPPPPPPHPPHLPSSPSVPRLVAPLAGAVLSSAQCSAAMRSVQHKFRILWSAAAWHPRDSPSDPPCWGDDLVGWFSRVAQGLDCGRNWGGLGPSHPSVFGYKETMESYCREQNGEGWNWFGDVAHCTLTGFNVLRIGDWEMCKNVQWMWCVVRDAGEIRFSREPAFLDIGPQSRYNADLYGVRVAMIGLNPTLTLYHIGMLIL